LVLVEAHNGRWGWAPLVWSALKRGDVNSCEKRTYASRAFAIAALPLSPFSSARSRAFAGNAAIRWSIALSTLESTRDTKNEATEKIRSSGAPEAARCSSPRRYASITCA
jgi:hypothetical protein